MLVQFQVGKDLSENVYKLVVKVITDNEISIAHTEVMDLEDSLTESFIKLMHPFTVDLKTVQGIATDEAVQTMRERQAQEASTKSTEEVAAV